MCHGSIPDSHGQSSGGLRKLAQAHATRPYPPVQFLTFVKPCCSSHWLICMLRHSAAWRGRQGGRAGWQGETGAHV